MNNPNNDALGIPDIPKERWLRSDGTVDKEKAARELSAQLIMRYGIAETGHIEDFLRRAHGITVEEHAEGAAWMGRQIPGIPNDDPEPPGITKMKQPVKLCDEFYDLCEEYKMYDNEIRFAFLSKTINAALEDEER